MQLRFPRCCILAIQRQQLVACLRHQEEVNRPSHKEVRTFDLATSNIGELTEWLVGQEVTYVAIERSARGWKPLSQELQKTFTVLLFDAATASDDYDIKGMADLVAYGLVPSHMARPEMRSAPTPPGRRKRLPALGTLFIVLITAYGVWWSVNRAATERPSTPPTQTVRWQPPQVSFQARAGEPFVLPLPTLQRPPAGVPVAITLETSDETLDWLQVDPERLHIRGTPPRPAAGQTYRLAIRANAGPGSESRLVVVLSIIGEREQSTSSTQLPSHWTW